MMHRVSILTSLAAALLVSTSQGLWCQQSGPIQKEAIGSGGGGGVNEFSGEFSYGIPVLQVPGPAGSGYTITLSYQSGTPFNEASWVGYGWSLGPGGIVRDKRGMPDDWVGDILYRNKTKRQYTVTAETKANIELMSTDMPGSDLGHLVGGFSPSIIATYNSRTGYSFRRGISTMVKGLGGLSYSVDEDEGSFSGYLDPQGLLKTLSSAQNTNPAPGDGTTAETPSKDSHSGSAGAKESKASVSLGFSKESDKPSKVMSGFSGGSVDYNVSFLASLPFFLLGFEFGERGSVTWYDNDPETSLASYGYMYSGEGTQDDQGVMDYYSERDIPYNKKNLFLPIPFSNADNYIIGGGGSFRMYLSKSGTFRPNAVNSTTVIPRIGTEFHGGGRWGLGVDVGIGMSTLTSKGWSATNEDDFTFPLPSASTCLFRMSNDRGGNVLFSESTAPSPSAIGLFTLYQPVQSGIFSTVNQGAQNGRGTYIAYHTNEEMLDLAGSFNKNAGSRALVARSGAKMKKGIGEFAIYDQSGSRYVYGLPVYARNEKTLSFGLEGLSTTSPGSIQSNSIAYKPIAAFNADVVIGQEMNAPYATSHLLTEITTPNYIDVDGDGPDEGDVGGYTLFNYRRAAGTTDKTAYDPAHPWFQWRTPYNGLQFHKGDLSDPEDDFGSMSSGEREQYYLESVETKTHIAIFVTNHTDIVRNGRHIVGSGLERRDSYGQLPFYAVMVEPGVANSPTATAAELDGSGNPAKNIQERLERIELYVKGWPGQPDSLLQTVHFDYDYSLRKGMPNSLPSTGGRDGLLTLKRVWAQDQSVAHPTISPYVFGYSYKKNSEYSALPSDIRTKYADIINFGDDYTEGMQNPDFTLFDADRWGNYQYKGADRSAILNPWVNQHPDPTKFDPAAWQLKTIQTPSGGELHVQYEQKDYAFVQNRPATAMVSLVESINPTTFSLDASNGNHYYLRLSDIGIDSTDRAQVAKAKALIEKEIIEKNKKMFFHFLYAYKGETAALTNSEYTSGYIDGFAKVGGVEIETITGGGSGTWYALRVSLKGASEYPVPSGGGSTEFVVPKKICWDFVLKNKRGKLGPWDGVPFGDHITMIATVLDNLDQMGMNAGDHCKDIDYANSYLRIPVPVAKLGGGVRVKRLLNYDPGVEGDGGLYGVEYDYTKYDEERGEQISSGVAVNEPSTGREENALFDFDAPELLSGATEKFIAGKDLQRMAGPVGESILPAASVGYARVTARSIHTGKTNPGFAVSDYLTAKDYPFDKIYPGIGRGVQYTRPDAASINPPFSITVPYFSTHLEHRWVTQGYSFALNSMHGQLKRSAQYGGSYADPDSWSLAALQEYNYFEPGEKLPVIDTMGTPVKYRDMGTEMEVAREGVSVSSISVDGKVEVDLSISPLLDVQVSAQPSLHSSDNSIQTSVTTKVIRYPAVVKNVLTYADGIYHFSENVAFNGDNGASLIARTTDGFDRLNLAGSSSAHEGSYYSYRFPASWQYPGMGQKARDLANTNQIGAVAGMITTYGDMKADVLAGTMFPRIDLFHEATTKAIAATAVLFAPHTDAEENVVTWRPISHYTYNTGVTGASKGGTPERSYNGGMLKNFFLFNWASPAVNDPKQWVMIDTVTQYSHDGFPVEMRDGLGIYSSTLFDYSGYLPVIDAVNARLGSVLFTSFEENPSSPKSDAHSGSHALHGFSDNATGYVGTFTTGWATGDVDGLIRFWAKFSDEAMKSSPENYIEFTLGGLVLGPTAADEVVRVGEWTLYEMKRTIPYYVINAASAMEVRLKNLVSTPDSAWIDDVGFQPVDAIVNSYVYDLPTYRLTGTLDADHFGIYSQYNAEGRAVRSIVETAEGRRTVMEVHPHIPRTASRSLSGGSSGSIVRERRPSAFGAPDDSDARLQQINGMPSGGSLDLLNIELGPEQRKVEVLGGEKPSLPNLEGMKAPDLEKLLPADAERLKLIDELRALDAEETAIATTLRSEEGADDAGALLERRSQLREKREVLLRKMGLTEEDARRLYQTGAEE